MSHYLTHLGNVLAVVSDKRTHTCLVGTTFDHYAAEITSANDYYPFGMIMPNRTYQNGAYRFGFNGMEKDDEVAGAGNSLNFGARIYDARICRWLSRDPKEFDYPWQSTFSYFANSPVWKIDYMGMGEEEGTKKHTVKSGESLTSLAQKYGTSVENIKKANPEVNWASDPKRSWDKKDWIYADEVLNIPTPGKEKSQIDKLDLTPQVKVKITPVKVKVQTGTKWVTDKEAYKAASVITGALVVDDATVVGVADDIAIPFVWVGALIIDLQTARQVATYEWVTVNRIELIYYIPAPRSLPGFPDAERVGAPFGRARWRTKKRLLEWDSQHGEIEVYDKQGNHVGTADPETGEMTKPPVKGRKTGT